MTVPADNSDPRDYVLDLSSGPAVRRDEEIVPAKNTGVRYLSIYFKCCKIYAPIYRNAASTAFAGHCPRCKRAARIDISPEGSTSRIFTAG